MQLYIDVGHSATMHPNSTMDYISFLFQATTTLLTAFLLYHIWKKLTKNPKTNLSPPEPKGQWPIIGHLHLLNTSNPPLHRTLSSISDQLGPIFNIRLGVKRALVISSWEAAKECFKTNDKVFLSRPESSALKQMGYNGAFWGLTPYGPFWHKIRKMSTNELLSTRRLELLRGMRGLEVHNGLRELYVTCTNKGNNGSCMVNMKQWFSDIIMRVILGLVVGKRDFGDESKDGLRRFSRCIERLLYLSGVWVLADVIPFLGWLDLQGHVKSMKANFKDLDEFTNKWLEEHLMRKERAKAEEEMDTVDLMIYLLANEDSFEGYEKSVVIKGNILNLVTAGYDPASVALTWALSLLLNHPRVLKTAQEELNNIVETERWVEECDFKNLPYLQAIIKETLRLYPPGLLSVPRESIEDCHLCVYYIPKGTRLFVNLWKLHRDPRVWPNPTEFRPQRFLDNSQPQYDLRCQHMEFLPFGTGRRACPGMSMGLNMMSLVLARVIQGFDLSTPNGQPIDMSEGSRLTMPKAKTLHVIISPRLPCKLYEY